MRTSCRYKWPWLWPYLDISFYDQNHTHLWDASPEFKRSNYVYSKSILFPIHWRPLSYLKLAGPRDTYAALVETYGSSAVLTQCSDSYYDHRYETLIRKLQLVVNCNSLKHLYCFVHRKKGKSSNSVGIVETLMLDNAIVSSVIVDEPHESLNII